MYDMLPFFGGPMLVVMMLPMLAFATIIPLAIYLVARWRNQHENGNRPDRHIGLKTALHLFRVVTFQLSLFAAFLFLLAIISEAPTGDFIRIAIGLGLPSGGLWFLHTQILTKTNSHAYPAVGRMFDGWNLIITAIPGMTAVIAVCVVALAPGLEGAKGDILRVVIPYLLAYTGGWVLLSYQWLGREGLIEQAPPGAGSIPPAASPPGPPAAGPPQVGV